MKASLSSVLSGIAALAIVILTFIGGKTSSPQLGNICFTLVFVAAVVGIGAGVVACGSARLHGSNRLYGLGWALANVLLGLVSAGVFLLVAFRNSQ